MITTTRVTLCLIVTVAIAAFGASPLLFRDQANPDVSNEALRRLKTQQTVPLDGLHSLFLQVTDAEMTGPTPDHVTGTVIFRTLFGVNVGETYDVNYRRWLGAWLVFIGTELVLCAYLFRRRGMGAISPHPRL